MVSTEDKKDRIIRPDPASVDADRKMLQDLGDKLRLSHENDITTFQIKSISEKLTELYVKYFGKDTNIDEKLEKFWFKVRGAAMSLSKQNEQTDKKFYTKALELGRKIKQLAEKLGAIAIPILINNEMSSFWG